MKIVSIFEEKLFAFHYDNEVDNELRRLLKLWNDYTYLYQFVTEFKSDAPLYLSAGSLINQIVESAIEIDIILNEIAGSRKKKLEDFFRHLENLEYRLVELSKQKGKKSVLRIYAIRIDENCFVVTGGAIKFHHLNKDRWHTQREMDKLDKCRSFLQANGVIDADSFNEFLIEE
ncbi:MAG: hypothetical protein ABIV51_03880 [Saprospiraceae bacterium]